MNIFKKGTQFLIAFTSFLLFIVGCYSTASAEPALKRLGGQTRYDTAITISQEGWKANSQYAILATGADFPDALSAAPLAKKLNAPILLITKDALSASVTGELKRLNVKTVYIIGGPGVISSNVETDLKKLNLSIIRIAGINRYETAIQIAKEVGLGSGEICIANGYTFQEALSISPIAAKKQIPILLVNKNEFPEALKTFLKDKNISKSYILGSTDLISNAVEKNFSSPIRIDGADCYERNINIIKYFQKDIDFSTVFLATGKDYPDALSGSALAPASSSCVVLVDDKNISNITKDFINQFGSKISTFSVLGLEGAVNTSSVEFLKTQSSASSSSNPLKIIEVN